jgi:hypothetical protein
MTFRHGLPGEHLFREHLWFLITLLITPVVYSLFDDLRGGRVFAWAKLPLTKVRGVLAWGWTRANGRLANGRRGR